MTIKDGQSNWEKLPFCSCRQRRKTLSNNKHTGSQSPTKESPVDADDCTDVKIYDGKNFYQRRAARTLPLYYLTNIMVIPLIYVGHGFAWPQVAPGYYVLCFFVATTWLFGIPITLNGASWFVSTLWFFYWLYPYLFVKIQCKIKERNMNVEQIKNWIVYCYRFELVISITGYCLLYFIFVDLQFFARYITTFWPPFVLPVFIMGIFCGFLRLKEFEIESDSNYNYNKTIDFYSIISILLFIVLFILDNFVFETFFDQYFVVNFWFQVILSYWQLKFVYYLTHVKISEGNKCMTYKFLTSKIMLYFGEISYSLYMIHEPIVYYIWWIEQGTIKPRSLSDDDYFDNRTMSNYLIPIFLLVSVLIAIVLHWSIEKPLRQLLRPK